MNSRLFCGCLLIGGQSSRMGQPKHLIKDGLGVTWLENSVSAICPYVDKVFISGRGRVPENLSDLPRLADQDGVSGPLAGMLSALERKPAADWLVLACDMPLIKVGAVEWLLEQFHASSSSAVIPRNKATGKFETLFACYRAEFLENLRLLASSGNFAINSLAGAKEVYSPVIPAEYEKSWANINYENELQSLRQKNITGVK